MGSGSGANEAIVVPAIEAPSSVVFTRSLGRRGVSVIGVSEDENATAFSSRYCGEAFLVPFLDEDIVRYKDALLKPARRDDVRTIVPLREQDTYVLSRFRSEFEPHVTRVWPSFESLRRVQDRVELAAVAEAADVPMPTTELLDEITDWSGDRIVKSRYALLTDEYLDSFPPGRSDEVSITEHLSSGVEPDVESIVAEMGHVPIA